MPRHTIEEWWVMYCLRFGIEQLTEPYCDGERNFTELVSEDLHIHREMVIVEFDKIHAKELLAARKPQ